MDLLDECFNLFLCENQINCMHFVLMLKHMEMADIESLVERLRKAGARISFDHTEESPHGIVLVDDSKKVFCSWAPAFRVEYVRECLKQQMVLDIDNFRQEATKHVSALGSSMDVVYFRTKQWGEVISELNKLRLVGKSVSKQVPMLTLRKVPESILNKARELPRNDKVLKFLIWNSQEDCFHKVFEALHDVDNSSQNVIEPNLQEDVTTIGVYPVQSSTLEVVKLSEEDQKPPSDKEMSDDEAFPTEELIVPKKEPSEDKEKKVESRRLNLREISEKRRSENKVNEDQTRRPRLSDRYNVYVISDDEEWADFGFTTQNLQKAPPAKTRKRLPYTDKEKENILKYIIRHDESDRVKGRELWQIMERRKVCGDRTWQSMKEHFIKKIIYELDQYDSILTQEQKKKLRRITLLS